MISVSHHWRY